MYLQSIKSVEHNAAKSVNRSILKKSRHLGFCVFIVHSSLGQTNDHLPNCMFKMLTVIFREMENISIEVPPLGILSPLSAPRRYSCKTTDMDEGTFNY